jgi:hypothetical protein
VNHDRKSRPLETEHSGRKSPSPDGADGPALGASSIQALMRAGGNQAMVQLMASDATPSEGAQAGGAQLKASVEQAGDAGSAVVQRMGGKRPKAAAAPAPSAEKAAEPVAEKAAVPVVEKAAETVAEKAADQPIGTLSYLVDLESRHVGAAEMKSARVGHAWIEIALDDKGQTPKGLPSADTALLAGGRDSMGFWPDMNGVHTPDHKGVGYSREDFAAFVQGDVNQPDNAHAGAEKAKVKFRITPAQLIGATKFAQTKKSAQYSLIKYNCAHFAQDVVKAAGHSPPSIAEGGMVMPDTAYDAILGMSGAGAKNAKVKGGTKKGERYVNEGDIGVTWKQRPLTPEEAALLGKSNVLQVASVRAGSEAEGILRPDDCVAFIDGIRCNSERTYQRSVFGAYGTMLELDVVDWEAIKRFTDQMMTQQGAVLDSIARAVEDRWEEISEDILKVVDVRVGRPLGQEVPAAGGRKKAWWG